VTEPERHSTGAERILSALAAALVGRPRWFFYPQMLLFLGCVCFTASKLGFTTSRNDLVSSEKRYHQNFLNFRKEFPVEDDLVILVESDDTEKNRQFVERLGAKLEAEPELFTNPFYRADFKMLGDKALFFLKQDELAAFREQLTAFEPFVSKFSRATNFISLFQLINTEFRLAEHKPQQEVEQLIGSLPALRRIVEQADAALHRPGPPPSPGIAALFGGEEAQAKLYITFDSGRMYLATVQVANGDVEARAVRRLEELVSEIRDEVPGLSVGVTGELILELDEMLQSQRDTITASLIALVFVGIIFVYGYQETGRPVKATACLLVGLGYTMGYTTLVVGHLNILTITFAPMQIGLAIDFGVHLITRYEEELRLGRSRQEAVRLSLVNTGQGIFTGALTTAAAFFAMGLTEFDGIREMGIIAGGGLLLSLVPMMTLLPILLLRGRQNEIDAEQSRNNSARRERWEQAWLSRPRTVIVAAVVLCGLCVSRFDRVFFDYNLLHMQSHDLPAVIYEEKLIKSAGNSVLFGAVVADSVEEATELEARIRQLPSVADVRSMASYLAENSGPKLALIREIRDLAAKLEFAQIDGQPVSPPEVSQVMYSFQGYIGAASRAVRESDGESRLFFEIQSLWDAVQTLRRSLNALPEEKISAQLAAFQRAFLSDLHETFGVLKRQRIDGGLTVADLPNSLRQRFVGVNGKMLLQVFPKDDVWEKANQAKFVAELRGIDPDVTGTPVQMLEYTTLLKDSYVEASWYALGATSLMVLFHFRSLVCMGLSLLPVVIGTLWLLGFMAWFGIPFNPANIMTLPLVAGIGVTSGIHILNRFREDQNPSLLSNSTGKAVLVSGLTTIAGFGSLTVAEHQGIESLGYVMSIGTATCMIAALTLLPAVIGMLNRMGWKNGHEKTQRRDMHPSSLGCEEPRPTKTSIN
jgi:hopanoid biosynthesis associated RND transporter like protein HpnN